MQSVAQGTGHRPKTFGLSWSLQTDPAPRDNGTGQIWENGYDSERGAKVHYIQDNNFHEEWGIPEPEAYRRNLDLFGDQYSNFNAGKILLYLEGLAGLEYSIPDDQLSVTPALPEQWDWMEIRLPVKGEWTKIRYEKDGAVVSGSPLPVTVNP